MDPMTIAAIANVALQLGSQLMNQGQQDSAMSLQQQALAQQKQAQDQALMMAMLKQRDPYGNVFNPRTGEYKLTDITQGILAGEQGEQLKGFTEDATRNRAARERADTRAREGETEFYNTLNEYRYGDRPEKEDYVQDYTRALMLARDRGGRETTQNIGRQAIRGLANSSVLQSLLRKGQENQGATLEEAILKGKTTGEGAFRNAQAGRMADVGGWLSKFQDVAGSTPQANLPNTSGLVSGLSGLNNIDQVISALQSGGTAAASGLSRLASTASSGGMNLGALGPSILGLGKALQPTPTTDPANSASWLTSTVPNAAWAMNNDVYGNPYAWNLPDVLEEERKAKESELNLN